jgi:betaine-aldehyde dehydrogenase
LKPCTLELGGKSAAIILEDADMEKHIPSLIRTSLTNNSQACISTTRILAPEGRYGEIVERLVAAVGALKVGDPREEDTDFGPLAAQRQRDRVEGYIQSANEQGARLVLGGGRPAGFNKGWYVEPTIFADVDNSMRLAREEVFGPVLSLIRYKTEQEAISIANDSNYGLGGGVFTQDIARGLKVASQLQTGSVQINDGPIAGGGGPFGGWKDSGIGREGGPEGIATHYQLRSVSLAPGVEP